MNSRRFFVVTMAVAVVLGLAAASISGIGSLQAWAQASGDPASNKASIKQKSPARSEPSKQPASEEPSAQGATPGQADAADKAATSDPASAAEPERQADSVKQVTPPQPVPATPAAPSQPETPEQKASPARPAPPTEPATTATESAPEQPAKPESAAKLAATKPLDLPTDKPAADIPEPADPVALKAFKVLDKHCARCHQAGRLDRLKPAKNLGNILMLDEVAADPNLVLPGNPDGSPVYVQMVKQEMPYDVFQEFSGGDEPTAEELESVRSWIESLGEKAVASCKSRDFIDNGQIASTIADDIKSEKAHRQKGMRYITLTHLYNACATDEEMNVYRQAVVKLLNSLSQNSDVLRLQTADPAQTIVKFHLDDLKWDEKDWDTILGVYPYSLVLRGDNAKFIEATTGTQLAWVRGDWLAYTASRPGLYNKLLKLPDSFAELEKLVGVDTASNIEKFRAKRAGFQDSLVSRNNRLIERHTIPTGVFWTSYDFAGNSEKQNLFEHPLGPKGSRAFVHDGGETIWSLPNGFNAYYLNTAEGAKLDHGPTTIVQDQSQRDLRVTNGISCFGCHNQGFRKATDEIREHILSDKSIAEDVREKVAALYPPAEEMKALLEQDIDRFRTAMRRAGIDPDLDFNGVEIINALSQRYERDVDIRLAAAEFGLTEDGLKQAFSAEAGEPFRIRRRLEQGTIPRDTFEARFATLVATVVDAKIADVVKKAVAGDLEVAKVGEKTAEETGTFDLTLFSDKSAYKTEDLAVFTVKSDVDCHLTLINVDSQGNGTVIFPNKFQRANFLPGGKEFQFPDSKAPFKFRLKDKGSETVIAVCNAKGETADGIQHDYKTRSFTPLGNYRSFLTRQIVVAGRKKVEEGKKAKAEADKADKDYGVPAKKAEQDYAAKDKDKKDSKTAPAAKKSKPAKVGQVLARTAIKFRVE